jgi:hypothetical protein
LHLKDGDKEAPPLSGAKGAQTEIEVARIRNEFGI